MIAKLLRYFAIVTGGAATLIGVLVVLRFIVD
jgi:hypothetical protein